MNRKAIILMSGGLDSLVSLGLSKNEYNITLGLTFDYGQKAVTKEVEAAAKICDYYKIEHRVIVLDWLRDITKTSLVSGKDLPTPSESDLNSEEFTKNSAKAVWVPNRNGVFLNIAGCFADSFDFTHIIFGANREEGATFPDNTQDFIDNVNREFEYSTLNKPKVVAPLINLNKNDIVKSATERAVPLNLTRSCYLSEEKNCGKCESCMRLKHALIENHREDIIREIF
ncbi:7-cyano-7-deazaguanine synthase QueC [bacterium]|nr:7-cyano-7-deazaguanine synthase QueC [bacterium]